MGVNTVMCSKCGLIYVNPRPIEAEMNKFYTTYYRNLYNAVDRPTKDYISKGGAESKAAFAFEKIKKYIFGEHITFMDIGCAEGTLIKKVEYNLPNSITYGIEPGKGFAEYAIKNTNANVFIGNYQNFFQKKSFKTFDIIASLHVLEHILDPIDFLTTIRYHLKKNGFIYIEVPNVLSNSSQRYTAHLAHVMSYDPITLKLLLDICGLEVVEMYLEGLPAKTPSMACICKKIDYKDHYKFPSTGNIQEKLNRIRARIKIKNNKNTIFGVPILKKVKQLLHKKN